MQSNVDTLIQQDARDIAEGSVLGRKKVSESNQTLIPLYNRMHVI